MRKDEVCRQAIHARLLSGSLFQARLLSIATACSKSDVAPGYILRMKTRRNVTQPLRASGRRQRAYILCRSLPDDSFLLSNLLESY